MYARKCMVFAAWCSLHGVRCMVFAAWCSLHGVRCMVFAAYMQTFRQHQHPHPP
ncbi:MAG: hypothetical protein IK144_12090 [Bacteroidaceae bacterium]|nr:hypothetical protein [Bacteroidaceae bacterium]